MKTLKLLVTGTLLTAALTVPILLHRRAQDTLRASNQLLRLRVLDTERMAVENGLLSNILANAKSSQSLSEAQLSELMKLRSEVGQFRSLRGETNRLGREIHQIRSGLEELAAERESGEASATALLSDQRELRLARLAKLRQWLAERPAEMIPELKFLSEESWVWSAEWTRVTDEEYGAWISNQRSNAEQKFAAQAFKAVKQFVRENEGRFPADLSHLKPYFESPIDDAILQRYAVVPAKSLANKVLAETGGDWVITQKGPPMNKKYDVRFAIGATEYHATAEDGRWDPAP